MLGKDATIKAFKAFKVIAKFKEGVEHGKAF